MKHLKKVRKFSRERDQRRALFKSLALAFFQHGRIATTEAKAKELRPMVERTITWAKNPTLATRRLLARSFSKVLTRKVINTAADYATRPGGYTRIIKTGTRKGDAARTAILELVKE